MSHTLKIDLDLICDYKAGHRYQIPQICLVCQQTRTLGSITTPPTPNTHKYRYKNLSRWYG